MSLHTSTRLSRFFTLVMTLLLAACSGGGGEGGNGVATDIGVVSVKVVSPVSDEIDDPSSGETTYITSSDSLYIAGTVLRLSEVYYERCEDVDTGPTNITVRWTNLETGETGSQDASWQTMYGSLWYMCEPAFMFNGVGVQFGNNTIEIVATNTDGETGTERVYIHKTESAPANITISSGDMSVVLDWDNVPNAVSYNLYHSTSPYISVDTAVKVESVAAPYMHSNLTNGTSYHYLLTSVDTDGIESAPSLVYSATAGWVSDVLDSGMEYSAESEADIEIDSDGYAHISASFYSGSGMTETHHYQNKNFGWTDELLMSDTLHPDVSLSLDVFGARHITRAADALYLFSSSGTQVLSSAQGYCDSTIISEDTFVRHIIHYNGTELRYTTNKSLSWETYTLDSGSFDCVAGGQISLELDDFSNSLILSYINSGALKYLHGTQASTPFVLEGSGMEHTSVSTNHDVLGMRAPYEVMDWYHVFTFMSFNASELSFSPVYRIDSPAIAHDKASNVSHIVYECNYRHLCYATDKTGYWKNYYLTTNSNEYAAIMAGNPAIGLDTNGNPHISYFTTTPYGTELHYLRMN